MARTLLKQFEGKLALVKSKCNELRNDRSVIHQVRINDVMNGLRNVPILLDYTTQMNEAGLLIHGKSLAELHEQLVDPQPESMFWYLLTGTHPTSTEVSELLHDIAQYTIAPSHFQPVLNSQPTNMDPSALFSLLILSMQPYSEFNSSYRSTARKELYKPLFKDSLRLIANLPTILALIYSRIQEKPLQSTKSLDLAGKLSEYMGNPDSLEFLRFFMMLYCDSGSGSAGVHTAKLIASTHADLFLAYSGAVSAISGPLHGGALALSIQLLQSTDISAALEASLSVQKRVPGFGHAAFQGEDPRFRLLYDFLLSKKPSSPYWAPLLRMMETVPPRLPQVRSRHFNGDLIAGLGFLEYSLSPLSSCLLAASRALGVASNLLYDRGTESPIEYSESVDYSYLHSLAI